MKLNAQTMAALALCLTVASARPSPQYSDPSDAEEELTNINENLTFPGNTLNCNGEAAGGDAPNRRAPKSACHALLSELYDNYVQDSPRHNCVSNDDGQCCVSWGKTVHEGATFTMLRRVAEDIINQCDDDQYSDVSGQHTKANVNGQTLKVCVSGRATGC